MPNLEAITVSEGSIPRLIVAAVLLLALFIVPAICWRKKHKENTRLRYLFIGALGFLLSARVLELIVHYFCLFRDSPVSRYINGHTAAYVVYGIITAGVFEECGRYVILRYILKKDHTRENAVLYGIGHGGAEVLILSLPQIVLFLLIDVLLSSGGMQTLVPLLGITEETAAAILPSVLTAAYFSTGAAFIIVWERAMAVCVHIGLTVLVFRGVELKQVRYLFFAVLLHMTVDILPALYQRGAVSLIACELWMLVWTAVIAFFAVRLYGKSSEA